jgi:hypothetical protein
MNKFIATLLLAGAALSGWSATSTINTVNRYAYDANGGWWDWASSPSFGVAIAEYVASGYIYSANVGWIRLGSGSPTNGIQYQNLSFNDYGVNVTNQNQLRGYGYGANVGWIAFEATGDPRIDLTTGILSGDVYSANAGWISLSNAFAYVQTDTIANGADTDSDGMADAWERIYFGSTAANPGDDPDGDGATNAQEYAAGTDPNNGADALVITSYNIAPGGTNVALTWQSVPTRNYRIEQTLNLAPATWLDSGLGLIASGGASTSATFTVTNAPMRFYHVRALRPLAP